MSRPGEAGQPASTSGTEPDKQEEARERKGTEARLSVSGVILAAGQAQRMGATKQLLAWGDGTILQTVIDHARESRLDEVVVVLGHDGERIRHALGLPSSGPLRAVVEASWRDGQSRSLGAGLSAVAEGADAAAVLLGDQPGVDAALIDRVLAALPGCEKPVHRPVHRAASGRGAPGHPVVLSRRIFSDAAALSGDEGARALLREHPDWLCAVEVDGKRPGDIDTPDDYERLRRGAH
ncbi:MAG: nucleotidyltransferase family protein [Deltaproteobacteria bacterium]|nr:nucleotidyltransferase family protein [Deltaproteobacteria bacterium]